MVMDLDNSEREVSERQGCVLTVTSVISSWRGDILARYYLSIVVMATYPQPKVHRYNAKKHSRRLIL